MKTEFFHMGQHRLSFMTFLSLAPNSYDCRYESNILIWFFYFSGLYLRRKCVFRKQYKVAIGQMVASNSAMTPLNMYTFIVFIILLETSIVFRDSSWIFFLFSGIFQILTCMSNILKCFSWLMVYLCACLCVCMCVLCILKHINMTYSKCIILLVCLCFQNWPVRVPC